MSGTDRSNADTNGFPRRWSAEVLKAAPLIAPARQFVYPQRVPGEEDALNRGALHVMVRPGNGSAFLATFALGFTDPALPSGVWACPDPGSLLAVAGGYAYLVNTETPEHSKLLEQRPVTAVLPAPEADLLLLAGFYDVLAVGAEGVQWRSGRLSWEGVILTEVRDGRLHGLGWDMFTDNEVAFAVDLETGTHEGGGYRR